MIEGKNTGIDRDWFKRNRIKGILRRLEAENERLMAEIEKLLRDYLVAMLDLTHKRLIRGQISLSRYYRDTQKLACCGERMNHLAEEDL